MTNSIRVMAVASTGGHWVQLMRLRPAFEGADVTYISTVAEPNPGVDKYLQVSDANMTEKLRLIFMFFQMAKTVFQLRPHVVVTTGAAPGFAAIVLAKMMFGQRVKTIWIDSIANSEELSTSGRQAKRWADIWLTQWPHLTGTEPGLNCWGAVL